MKRSRMQAFLWAIALSTVGLLVTVLAPDDLPVWFKASFSIAGVGLLGWLFYATLRSSTEANIKAIHVRGVAGRRRLAWEDIQDIRAEANPGATMQNNAPEVFVYAYSRAGKKVLLPFLDDQHVNVERELGVLLAAWEELRGEDWAPSPEAAAVIDRRNARQGAVWAGLSAVMIAILPLMVLVFLPLFLDLPGWLASILSPFNTLLLGPLLIFVLAAVSSYRRSMRSS